MSELEFWVSICSLLVTSFISLLTIIVNIWLTAKKTMDDRKEKNYERHKEALMKYYMPIKFCLKELECAIKESDGKYFSIFAEQNDTISIERHKEVLKKYKKFSAEFDKLPLFFTNNEIDKLICQLHTHISVALLQSGGLGKDEAQLPSLEGIIKKIDIYAEQYQIYVDKGNAVLVQACKVLSGSAGIGTGFFLRSAICTGIWWLYIVSGIFGAITIVSMAVLLTE